MSAIDFGLGPDTPSGDTAAAAFAKLQSRMDAAETVPPNYDLTGAPGLIITIGDSIPAGLTADFGWPTQMGFGSTVSVNNQYAQSGHKVSDIANDIPGGLAGFYNPERPSIIHLSRFVNDIRLDGRSAADIYADWSTYIPTWKNQGHYVVVSTPTFYTDNYGPANGPDMVEQGGALIRANTAGADVVLDFQRDTIMGGRLAPNNTAYYSDKLHPNTAGQLRLRDIARPVWYNLLRRIPRAPAAGGKPADLALTGAAYDTGKFGRALSAGRAIVPPTVKSTGAPRPETVEFRFKVGQLASDSMVMAGQTFGDNNFPGWYVGVTTGGNVRCYVSSDPGNNHDTVERYDDGAWHHCEIVFDEDGFDVYIDGVLKFALAAPAQDHPMTLRYFAFGGGYNFNGLIDEVAIWPVKLHTDNFTPRASAYAGTEGMTALYALDDSGKAA